MKLSKERIDEIFSSESEKTSQETLIDLFKEVLPQWENIEKINGYLTCSRKTSDYICKLFIEKDRKSNSFPGGLWLNYGFSVLDNNGMNNWIVSAKNCKIIMKKGDK